jgi:hypothetical protein
LVEWAVFGEPSGSSMWSALPWSAVTMQAPPRRGPRRRPRRGSASTVSTASTAAGIDAGVADHVRVGEVDDPERGSRPRPVPSEGVGAPRGAHLGLVVVGRDVARRVDQARSSPSTPARGRR